MAWRLLSVVTAVALCRAVAMRKETTNAPAQNSTRAADGRDRRTVVWRGMADGSSFRPGRSRYRPAGGLLHRRSGARDRRRPDLQHGIEPPVVLQSEPRGRVRRQRQSVLGEW